MSYDISWAIEAKTTKPLKQPFYITVGDYPRRRSNITYNVKAILEKSTGMVWQDGDMGILKDIIPRLKAGVSEIKTHLSEYKALEPSNGWGTAESVIDFYESLILDYKNIANDETYGVIADDIHFLIS